MADLDMQVLLSREYLGLTPLAINDHVRFKIGAQFLGGAVDYDRVTAGSAYMDGEVTTSRKKQMVTEPSQVEILGQSSANSGESIAACRQNHDDLVDAIGQHAYTLTVVMDDSTWKYQCEASGYTIAWQGVRWMARHGLMTINLRRHPVPLEGRS